MNIKRFFFAFAAAAAAIFASSCEQNLTPGGDGKISVAQTELSFEIDGGSKTVTLHAGMDWELQGYDDEVKQWLSINPASGKASDQDVTVTFTALANEGGNRSASITFYGNVLQKATLTVNQLGPKGDAVESITITEFLELKDTQNEKVICGTVTEKATAEKYWGVVLQDETGTLSCPFPSNWDDYKDQIAVGKKVTIKGVYNYYENKKQDQMKNGEILRVEDGDPLPPVEGEIYAESFNGSFGEWTIEDKSNPDAITIWVEKPDYACIMASAYVNETNHDSESWIISPVIDLSEESSAYLEYEQAVNFFSSLDVAKEQAVPMIRVEGGDWTALTVPTWPVSLSWSFRNTGSIDICSYAGKKVQLAFKYVSTSAKAGSWEIKNVKITEGAQAGPIEDKDFKADITWVINDVKDSFAEATREGYNNGFSGTKDGITVSFFCTNNTPAVAPTDLLKLYKTHVLFIDSEKTLKAVRFTCADAKYCLDLTAVEPTDIKFTLDTAALTIKAEAESTHYGVQANAGQVRFTMIEFDFVD